MKTGSIGKVLILLETLINTFKPLHFRSSLVECTFYNKGNELNCKRNQKSKCEKINLSLKKRDLS